MKKILRITSFFMLLTALSACSFTGSRQMYRPGNDQQSMLIDGSINIPYVDILVNGQNVIHGFLNYPGRDSLVGNYKGKKISANCHMHRGFFVNDFDCDVFVNDEFATNITFK